MELSVALVQCAPALGKLEENCAFISETLGSTEADVIVFPELCTTGYFFTSSESLKPFALDLQSEVVRGFHNTAKEKNSIVVIGFAERDKSALYNSAMILLPNEEMPLVYRKTHLFYKEYLCFEPGNTGFFVVGSKEKDVKIGTMICYDWRFPESARTLALLGADLIACPSNLVTGVWHIAMPCRALENKVYVAVANRYGTEKNNDEELLFKGESALWSYNGTIIKKADIDGDCILKSTIDPEKTRDKSFNSVNNIFKDRRKEMYL